MKSKPVSFNTNTLMNVKDVADQLQCSQRTVYRLSDTGRLPKPIRLGALLRWDRSVIERWIASGCPARKGGK